MDANESQNLGNMVTVIGTKSKRIKKGFKHDGRLEIMAIVVPVYWLMLCPISCP